ncbi:mediator of RNA polymerase II transcription subunit 6 [Monosporozyma unispora]|nr:Mediator of RNA polymerase II transcription subunit 6 [Kazachstania unispora]
MNGTPLDELQWKSPEWIQSFGLRTDNVLDYFAESPFFDKTSNNYVIKMQRQFSQLPGESNGSNIQPPPVSTEDDGLVLPTGEKDGTIRGEFEYMDAMRQDIMNKYPLHAAMERELSKLTGVEYVLVAVREPDFWVIRKQQRNKGNQPSQFSFEIIKDYYIIGANVYQSPTIYKVIKNRLMSTSLHLAKTVENIYQLTHFEPSQGVQFKQRQQDEATTGNKTIPQTARTNGPTPSTVNSMTMMNTVGNTVSNMNSTTQASPYDTVHREIITGDMMDKLLTTSIKSEPEYI